LSGRSRNSTGGAWDRRKRSLRALASACVRPHLARAVLADIDGTEELLRMAISAMRKDDKDTSNNNESFEGDNSLNSSGDDNDMMDHRLAFAASCIGLAIRLVVRRHVDDDDDDYNGSYAGDIGTGPICCIVAVALSTPQGFPCRMVALDLLSAWTTPDPSVVAIDLFQKNTSGREEMGRKKVRFRCEDDSVTNVSYARDGCLYLVRLRFASFILNSLNASSNNYFIILT